MRASFEPLGAASFPAGWSAPPSARTPSACIDTSFHGKELELLTELGAVAQPVSRSTPPEEVWVRAYRTRSKICCRPGQGCEAPTGQAGDRWSSRRRGLWRRLPMSVGARARRADHDRAGTDHRHAVEGQAPKQYASYGVKEVSAPGLLVSPSARSIRDRLRPDGSGALPRSIRRLPGGGFTCSRCLVRHGGGAWAQETARGSAAEAWNQMLSRVTAWGDVVGPRVLRVGDLVHGAAGVPPRSGRSAHCAATSGGCRSRAQPRDLSVAGRDPTAGDHGRGGGRFSQAPGELGAGGRQPASRTGACLPGVRRTPESGGSCFRNSVCISRSVNTRFNCRLAMLSISLLRPATD